MITPGDHTNGAVCNHLFGAKPPGCERYCGAPARTDYRCKGVKRIYAALQFAAGAARFYHFPGRTGSAGSAMCFPGACGGMFRACGTAITSRVQRDNSGFQNRSEGQKRTGEQHQEHRNPVSHGGREMESASHLGTVFPDTIAADDSSDYEKPSWDRYRKTEGNQAKKMGGPRFLQASSKIRPNKGEETNREATTRRFSWIPWAESGSNAAPVACAGKLRLCGYSGHFSGS